MSTIFGILTSNPWSVLIGLVAVAAVVRWVYLRIKRSGYDARQAEVEAARAAASKKKDELDAETSARSDDDVRRRVLEYAERRTGNRL